MKKGLSHWDYRYTRPGVAGVALLWSAMSFSPINAQAQNWPALQTSDEASKVLSAFTRGPYGTKRTAAEGDARVDFLAAQGCAIGPSTIELARAKGFEASAIDVLVERAGKDPETARTGDWIVLSRVES